MAMSVVQESGIEMTKEKEHQNQVMQINDDTPLVSPCVQVVQHSALDKTIGMVQTNKRRTGIIETVM
jgi:hypothetical protein